jgi:hypothetical protein
VDEVVLVEVVLDEDEELEDLLPPQAANESESGNNNQVIR